MLTPNVIVDELITLNKEDGTEVWLIDNKAIEHDGETYIIAQGIYFNWTPDSIVEGIKVGDQFSYRVHKITSVVAINATNDLLCYGLPDMQEMENLPAFKVERN